MAQLAEVLADKGKRQQVVADAAVVLDQEVADKSGLSGMAVKGTYAIMKGLKPGVVPEIIDGLVDEFAGAVDPIVGRRPEGTGVESFLNSKTHDVVQALLAVTDKRAERSSHQTLIKLYQKLRPTAEKNVAAAIPRVAKLVAKHVGG